MESKEPESESETIETVVEKTPEQLEYERQKNKATMCKCVALFEAKIHPLTNFSYLRGLDKLTVTERVKDLFYNHSFEEVEQKFNKSMNLTIFSEDDPSYEDAPIYT